MRLGVVVGFRGETAKVARRESADALRFLRNRVAEVFVGRNAGGSRRRRREASRIAVECSLPESRKSGGASSFRSGSRKRLSLCLRVIIIFVWG